MSLAALCFIFDTRIMWLDLFLKFGALVVIMLHITMLSESTESSGSGERSDLGNGQDGQTQDEKQFLITADIYAKLFLQRRKEQHFMAKEMLKLSYEKKYKLLELLYAKVFEVISAHNMTLRSHDYQGGTFPRNDPHLQEAVVLILENCCVAGESLLHFPSMSYRIFRTNVPYWKPFLNWCIAFVNTLPHVTDESTVRLMELLQQEINEELRTENYINPYYKQSENDSPKATTKKPRKKLKKGPQLTGGRNEL